MIDLGCREVGKGCEFGVVGKGTCQVDWNIDSVGFIEGWAETEWRNASTWAALREDRPPTHNSGIDRDERASQAPVYSPTAFHVDK